MRLVFVLYAEERDLMPADALYEANYGLRGLFKKLRDDAARHGDDLMDRRYGAWARLLALFRPDPCRRRPGGVPLHRPQGPAV